MQGSHASRGQLDAARGAWVIGSMVRTRSDILPGWRAGLLVLGLYATFLQAFFAGLVGPVHAWAGLEGAAICVAGTAQEAESGPQPVGPQTAHDCVCVAMCHAAGALPGRTASSAAPVAILAPAAATLLRERLPGAVARALPPARGPPGADVGLHS